MIVVFGIITLYLCYDFLEEIYLNIKTSRIEKLSFYDYVKKGRLSELIQGTVVEFALILLILYSIYKG